MTTRARSLRAAIGWSQYAMAEFLGVEQPTAHRLDHGRDESGPESRLLDFLSAALEDGRIKAGCSPAEALAAISVAPVSPTSPPDSTGDDR